MMVHVAFRIAALGLLAACSQPLPDASHAESLDVQRGDDGITIVSGKMPSQFEFAHFECTAAREAKQHDHEMLQIVSGRVRASQSQHFGSFIFWSYSGTAARIPDGYQVTYRNGLRPVEDALKRCAEAGMTVGEEA